MNINQIKRTFVKVYSPEYRCCSGFSVIYNMVFRHVVLMVFFPEANHLAYIYTKVGIDDHCGAGKEKSVVPLPARHCFCHL